MKLQLLLTSFSYKKLLGMLVPNCKRCGGDRLRKDGLYKSYQQYKCKNCGFRFSYSSDLPRRRFHSKVIDFAVDLYTRLGASLRTIARKIKKYFGLRVNHVTIHRWIKDFPVPETELKAGRVWQADETAFKVKGVQHWLWLVISHESRQVISWHISKARKLTDARIVIHKAKIKTMKPRTITTDKLQAYIKGIKKEYGWRDNPHKQSKNAAFGANTRIERLNREVKRRVKWFSTFQSLEGAKTFIKNWINQYNTEKAT